MWQKTRLCSPTSKIQLTHFTPMHTFSLSLSHFPSIRFILDREKKYYFSSVLFLCTMHSEGKNWILFWDTAQEKSYGEREREGTNTDNFEEEREREERTGWGTRTTFIFVYTRKFHDSANALFLKHSHINASQRLWKWAKWWEIRH